MSFNQMEMEIEKFDEFDELYKQFYELSKELEKEMDEREPSESKINTLTSELFIIIKQMKNIFNGGK